MNKNDGKSRPEPAEQADSLSATGMFLRAFETSADGGQQPSDPFAPMPEPVVPPKAVNLRDDILAQSPPPSRGSSPQEAGSFTQMFSAVEPKRQAPAAQTPVREVVVPASPQPAPPAAGKGPVAAADQGAGEFTRIFVAGPTPAAAPQNKNVEEAPRTTPAAAPSRGKGFSAPGVSGSVSGESSFTQFFKAAPAASTPRPAPANAAPSPMPPAAAPSSKPSFESSWKDDPIFRQPAQPPSNSGPSVTSLLSSLGTPGRPAAGSREPEPAAYRPESAPFIASPPSPAQAAGGEQGGVTRLIQRLAHEPPAAAVPPPPPQAPPVSSGPGEFTRMIASLGPNAAAGAPAPAAAAPAPAAAPPPPIAVTFTPPAIPAVSMAAPPVAPMMQPPAAHVQGVAMPAMHAPVLPPMPKPAPLPPLAVAAPKSKLEAMVPYLLVVNTFLLLVLLMVVIFLIKSK